VCVQKHLSPAAAYEGNQSVSFLAQLLDIFYQLLLVGYGPTIVVL
jgi:hypothetical protein